MNSINVRIVPTVTAAMRLTKATAFAAALVSFAPRLSRESRLKRRGLLLM